MSNRNKGRIAPVDEHERLYAATHLAQAIAALGIQQDTGEKQDTIPVYGVDIGEVVSCIAMTLDYLGFETEANGGGFGKPPTLTVKHPDDPPTEKEPTT